MPAFIVFADDPAPSIALPTAFAGLADLRWRLIDDVGFAHGGEVNGAARIALPMNLPPGAYRLSLIAREARETFRVLVRPPHAYLSPAFQRGERAWGFGVNLYALRSARNWGVGDFTDLKSIIGIASELGARIVGVNPLHALNSLDPKAVSPYSPLSRFFLNPTYIDVEAIPEFATIADRFRADEVSFREALAWMSSDAHVTSFADLIKRSYLEALHATFQENASLERRRAFDRFVTRDPVRLQRFTRYEALNEKFAPAKNPGGVTLKPDGTRVQVLNFTVPNEPPNNWLSWPETYRDPASPEVERFALEPEARRRIDFFTYLQFVADEQLASVSEYARSAGVVLYCDLAVGVAADSADVWAERDKYLFDRTIGAPPDPLGPLGQNWGLAPLDPVALERDGGATIAALLRANMAHAGALRIDHVMSLGRLFLIPRGGEARDGAYGEYPLETALAATTIESARAECLVIGEDLGTVVDGFRERMVRESILSYRVLLFGREHDGSFSPPEAYPASSLATGSTHDLPTLPGWVLGRDIDARARAGLAGDEAVAQEHAVRRVDATRLLEALQAAGELDGETVERLHRTIDQRTADGGAYAARVAAAYRFLANTPARIVLVQLDDILGELDQVNVPGTFNEYPNWRRKNHVAVEDIAGDERVKSLAAQLCHRIRGGPVG